MIQEDIPMTSVETATNTEQLAVRLSSSSSAPIPCTDDELREVDFSRLDVLVGTVRSDEQFAYCVDHSVYYAPVRVVDGERLPVSFVALYEEGINRRSGIKRYGRVTETAVVKRGDIPVAMSRANPEEAYYLFRVEEWQLLTHPISIAGTGRGRPAFTSEFLLTHARRSYQLTAIRSPEVYRLCCLLCDLQLRWSEGGGKLPTFRRVGERHILTLSEGRLSLLDENGNRLYTCHAEKLEIDPAEVLRRVAEGLGL